MENYTTILALKEPEHQGDKVFSDNSATKDNWHTHTQTHAQSLWHTGLSPALTHMSFQWCFSACTAHAHHTQKRLGNRARLTSMWYNLSVCDDLLALTRLLHVGYDPVEGHFRAHVPCVVNGLPTGLQREAHLRQLHCRRLVYSCGWGQAKKTTHKHQCPPTLFTNLEGSKGGFVFSLGLIKEALERIRAGTCCTYPVLTNNKKGLITNQVFVSRKSYAAAAAAVGFAS